MNSRRPGWVVVIGLYGLLATGWLVRGLLPGSRYPGVEIVLDYLFSGTLLGLSALLAGRSPMSAAKGLLCLGMIGVAAGYNPQAAVVGHDLHVGAAVVFNGVGTAALAAGLLASAGGLAVVTGVLAACAGVVAVALSGYAPSTVFLLTFGFLLPLVALLPVSGRSSSTLWQARLVHATSIGVLSFATLVVAAARIAQGLQAPGLPDQIDGISVAGPVPWHYPGALAWLGAQVPAFWLCRVAVMIALGTLVWNLIRPRIADVDWLIGRTVLYSVLVTLVGACYVVGVVRIDASFGLDSDWLAPPQVAAAGVAAVAFLPVKSGLTRLVDRIAYGRTLRPDQVVAQVTALARVGSRGPDALRSLARLVATTSGADRAGVHLVRPDGTETSYWWPESGTPPTSARRIDVVRDGTTVGALTIPMRGTLPRHRRALLDDLTGPAAVILHNSLLSADLDERLRRAVARSAEIRTSRWRIVTMQDWERRDLERDLHDVAQPELTAIRFAMGLVNHLAERGTDTAATLERLRAQITSAQVRLRQTLQGIDPPTLTSDGVVAALRETAVALQARVEFRVGPDVMTTRADRHVEAALYYCCAEALQNTAKHSPDATVTVTLEPADEGRSWRFEVSDDGVGFDPATAGTGSGLQNMTDRVAAVDGEVVIESRPGVGTRVRGRVPVTAVPTARG